MALRVPISIGRESLSASSTGLQKYGRLLRPGETARDALIREKRREDALRAQGIMVVRWTWATLERRELVGVLAPWLDMLAAA